LQERHRAAQCHRWRHRPVISRGPTRRTSGDNAMNDTSISVLSPAQQQLEIETLRDQRDLYRSLLLSEPTALGAGLNYALASVEQLRELLRAPTRDSAAFRGKIEQLLAELDGLAAALMALHLPTVSTRLASAQRALRDIEHRPEISGND